MPFVRITTSEILTAEKFDEARKIVFDTIQILPNKTPEVTMVHIEEGEIIGKGPCGKPAMYVDVRVFTRPPMDKKKDFVKAISAKLAELTNTEEQRIYITFLELNEWGSNGNYNCL